MAGLHRLYRDFHRRTENGCLFCSIWILATELSEVGRVKMLVSLLCGIFAAWRDLSDDPFLIRESVIAKNLIIHSRIDVRRSASKVMDFCGSLWALHSG